MLKKYIEYLLSSCLTYLSISSSKSLYSVKSLDIVDKKQESNRILDSFKKEPKRQLQEQLICDFLAREVDIIKREDRINLDNHEGGSWGGHTISKHANDSWTDGKLLDRKSNPQVYNNKQERVKAVSAFSSKLIAEKVIAKAMLQNWKVLEAWMLDVDDKSFKTISYCHDNIVGRGIKDPDTIITNKTKIKVILKKYENQFKIFTAYPE